MFLMFSPNAPTSLTAIAAAGPQVNLAWTGNAVANPPTTNYLIQRSTDPAFTTDLTTISVAALGTTYVDTSVGSGVTYYYRVRAENVSAYSDWSNVAFVTTSGAPLPAPTGLSATVTPTPLSVGLTWTNNATVPPATGITIQRATDAAFTLNVATFSAASATATSYADTTVAAGTTYYYRVRAVAGASVSAWSNTATAVTLALPAPSALTAAAFAGPPLQVNLAWVNNATAPPVTSISVQRATDAAFTLNVTTFSAALATSTSYADTTVVNFTTYYYRVRAVAGAGVSAWSNTASVTVAVGPAAPTSLRLVSKSTNFLAVAWNNNGGGTTSNRVQISTVGPTGPWTTKASLNALSTSYTITGLTSATNYWVRILAVNAAGQSTPSNVLAPPTTRTN
jgi:fibronectin type 3 domain-containing protein